MDAAATGAAVAAVASAARPTPPPPPAAAPPTKQGFRFYKSGSGGNNHHHHHSTSSLASSSEPSHPLLSPQPLPPGVDQKLYQIVKRIVVDTPSLLISSAAGSGRASQQSRKNSAQAVTSLVLEKHREYRRKEYGWVRSGVDGALHALGSEGSGIGDNGGDNIGGSGGKKRRSSAVPVGGGTGHCANGDDSNAAQQQPARKKRSAEVGGGGAESAVQENPTVGAGKGAERIVVRSAPPWPSPISRLNSSSGGGMLNASLRNRYREQAEQQLAASNASGSVVDEIGTPGGRSASSPSSTAGDDQNANNQHESKTPQSESADGNNNSSAATKTATPKRKKKTKKTPSKPSASNFRTHDGQDEDGNPYSSSAALLQPSPRPTERYSDLGGVSSLLTKLRELIEYPLSHPEIFLHLGVEPPRGVLLRGPPGCGKTHLAKAIAGELNVSYFQVSAPELVGGVSGESEQRVRTLFESARNCAPAIIFVDEIDAIAPKRGEGSGGGGGKSMEKRIVAQLLTSMDSIHPNNTRNRSAVMVLGATNRPDAMDPALRRAGRFDREIVLGAPDERAREGILRVMTKNMRVDESLDFAVLARKTPGFVGADCRSLTKEAAVIAINRIFHFQQLLGGVTGDDADAKNADETVKVNDGSTDTEEVDCGVTKIKDGEDNETSNDIQSITPLTTEQLKPLFITMDDFVEALQHVQPSSKREGFATVPDVTWSDIGALSSIREELTLSVLEPIGHPERFEALGLPLPAGVLLYGPPGCGKTLLAKAIAHESGANFISVKGPELLDKYVGESERAVRVVFERARTSSPCIIFFDELDSLCPKRGSDGGSGGGGVSERVVNQLLTEMDGLDNRRSVFVIAATNRPELIDPAMLRPGRLDKLLYVSLPSPSDRHSILQALSAKIKLGPDVDLHAIAHDPHSDGFSGADCAALLREAGLAVLRDGVMSRTTNGNNDSGNNDGVVKGQDAEASLQITAQHFEYAFKHVMPSVSKKDQARYDRLRDRMARARTRGGAGATEEATDRGGTTSDVENAAVPASKEE